MSTQSKGFIQLEWECPQCQGRNPGPAGSCLSCGAPQPDNVEFVAPAKRAFVQDEKAIAHAKAGADIYCAFCNTRNPATAEACSQCGADLKEGERRKSGGSVTQQETAATVHCQNCEAENPATNTNCLGCGIPLTVPSLKSAPVAPQGMNIPKSPVKLDKKPKLSWILGSILLLIICCVGGFIFLFSPSKNIPGTVSDVRWETSVGIEAEQEVKYHDETRNPPSDAYDISCHTEQTEICTERTIDRGNGYAEVVNDCRTQNDEYCSYSVLEWQTVETLTLDGNNYDPRYAQPSLSSGQRLGSEQVDYSVFFNTERGTLDYSPTDLDEYRQYQLGSSWTLSLNRLGGIVSVER